MNFENARKMAKLTQNEVAQMLNTTQATLSSYENGRTEPDLSTLLKLSEIYDVSVDVLLDNKKFINANSDNLPIPTEKKQAVKILLALPEKYFNKIYGNLEVYNEMLNLSI